MKELLIILTLTFITWASLGQRGSISANGKKFEASTAKVSNFKLDSFDTLLTKITIEYLNEFGSLYRDSLHRKQRYVIQLTPDSTNEERDLNWHLTEQRLMVIINYLEKTFGIDKSEFRVRFLETVTISCEAFLATDNHKSKRKKKEKQ